jgi:hypothetical protein
MTRAALALAVLGAMLVHATAAAQDASSEDAQALFEQGRVALEEGRPAEAREPLERSFLLSPRPATAFNLIVAYWGSGRPVAAGMLCERLLDGAFGEIEQARRAQAEEVCASARADVAHLDIDVEGRGRATIRIDGESAGETDVPGSLERDLDPGRHVLTARAPGAVADERTIELGRGERATVRLRLVPSNRSDRAEGGPRAWPFVLAGCLAVAAVVLIVVLVATTGGQGDPVGGDFPVTATLRL